jgi:plastocyanin
VSTIAAAQDEVKRHHHIAGLVTLLSALVLIAGTVFGLVAGAAAIWSSVAGSPQVSTLAAGGAAGGSGQAAIQSLHLVVKEVPNGAGQMAEAFVPASFTMKTGETLRVTVTNYTSMPHTWSSTGLGVNAMIAPGGSSSPSTTTFTIDPHKAGTYSWQCETPCDPWSMGRMGFMEGSVTVVRA